MYENENIMDYLANDENFKNIQVELLEEGKSVIDNNQLIANGQLYVIYPDRRAFLIRVEDKENIKERELTPKEYEIMIKYI